MDDLLKRAVDKVTVDTLKEMCAGHSTFMETLQSMKPVEKEYMSNEEADKMLQESMREIFDDLDYEARLLELQLEHSAWRAKATTIGVAFGLTMYCLGLWMGQL